MRIDKVGNPILEGIPFKGDEDIFKKPDLSSDNYVQSQKPPYDDINTWKTFCQPLRDTFEKVKPQTEEIKVEEVEKVEECENDRCKQN